MLESPFATLVPRAGLVRRAVLGAVVCFAVIAPALGDQAQLTPLKDNTLYEDPNGALSNGLGSAMFAGKNSMALARRAVLAFDVASVVPAGATIDAVTLTLTENGSNAADQTIALHRLLADWGEGSSVAGGNQGGGGPAMAGDATWLHRFFNTDLWAGAGGDFDPAVSTQTTVGPAGVYTWPSTAPFVSDVQHALDNPSGHFGWVLLGNEQASNTAKRFATRNEANAGLRPVLTIDYTPIPEPGAVVGLVLLVGLSVARVRRLV